MEIDASLIDRNTATDTGGGIHNAFSTLAIYESTLSNNTAGRTGGGGIFTVILAETTLNNVTFSGNSPDDTAGEAPNVI